MPDRLVKLFPSENVYCSIEFHLKHGEVIDKEALIKDIAILDEFKYVPPKWPVGILCPVCNKGTVGYKKFQSTKPGPNQGKWYANYSCSTKDCSFVAWCDASDDSRTPKDEPFNSQFLAKKNGSAKQTTAKPAAAAPATQPVQEQRGSAVQPVDDLFDDNDLPF